MVTSWYLGCLDSLGCCRSPCKHHPDWQNVRLKAVSIPIYINFAMTSTLIVTKVFHIQCTNRSPGDLVNTWSIECLSWSWSRCSSGLSRPDDPIMIWNTTQMDKLVFIFLRCSVTGVQCESLPSCTIKAHQSYIAGKQTEPPSTLNVLGLSKGLLRPAGVQNQELLLNVRVCTASIGIHSQVETKLRLEENKHRRSSWSKISRRPNDCSLTHRYSHLNTISA